ncbi:MAG: phosphoglycerate mutase [Lysobacter sp.]|nr:phosphoglycerate mutase [Lysobacter sp.]
MSRATLLLSAAARFGKQGLNEIVARALGRADMTRHDGDGRRAQLQRHFNLAPNHWPIAALTRQADAGDAALSAWLRVDPAHVQPDINGARLLACGDMLALTEADSAALLPALKPLFGDVGFPIDAPTPSHWYLRVPRESKLPAFTEPGDALGDDLFEHLAEGTDGRRWRALLSEAQVVLHNHPWNAHRIAQGKMPVNSLWFWGGGVLPDAVRTNHNAVYSSEETVRALANGICAVETLPPRFPGTTADVVFDLPTERDLARLQNDWLLPALLAVQHGELDALQIDFADGAAFDLERSQRWRFWRKPMTCLNP